MYVAFGAMLPKGYQQISGLAASTALTVPAGAAVAVIQALTQNVRYRDDGGVPTSAVGMRLTAGNDMLFAGSLTAVRFIQESATAELNVLYYG